MNRARAIARHLARTPLHPQWLLGARRIPDGLREVTGRILDVGAADKWLKPCLHADAHYIALDLPATGGVLYDARPDVFADAAMLPFNDASMDAVICFEVIEHVRDPSAVIGEITRVLRSGGRAWLSMPFLYPVHDAPYDYQRYTEHGWRRDLDNAGLVLVTMRRNEHSVRAAGLLACLSLAGALEGRRGPVLLLLFPLAAAGILVCNLVAWFVSKCWPDWPRMSTGHHVEAVKP